MSRPSGWSSPAVVDAVRAAIGRATQPTRNHLTVAAVAVVLGLLAVGQLRGLAGAPSLSGLSALELTQVIANLNARNDQLRNEIAGTSRQAQDLTETRARGETVVDQLRGDLERIRAWSGVTEVAGQGIVINVQGRIGGDGVEDLLNELRNAGAEAIAIDGTRLVMSSVVAGAPGGLSIENTALGDSFEIRAVGSPQILTGTLTRTGGVIAQIGATYPEATVNVTPVDHVAIPATTRDLIPDDATPRL
jgi:uncharacterized protein YlxW (UPF0749 family)